ncbi:Extradiol aromatic ring-opening dioxygenase [Coccomyxa subellipsoidea C-169]|uniref:Extradiol aromatic ring-opening dioxygenase n=1 Tax=Coccomyxa subellipsoidea (strain C-169) TaxID=574566 RepID=I0Z182_COCSC|nr:Extradiol aromatic ring-opening dioxygenase [Coccomyxa subellipsoidea C-169]EIE24401.1 Extradiol aromatic ring-opening dioxygenase [Coccomyxa subellipsoidea C-169]|eukprot:XP_005648945.1 Extradiol aromatic ring-opening dioxygenase [Coccomyxa subellipsoidea C-169]
MNATTSVKQPAVFVAHGGGPLPLLGHPGHAGLTKWLQRYSASLHAQPKAILVISAHWEEANPTLTSGTAPELIYDYYGFPPESYQIKYPAPGSANLAQRAAGLLREAGFAPKLDAKRGFDHGTFVPLKLAFPAADIPVVQLSMLSSLNPQEHMRMGQAISALRDEGVLLFGSGMSFHNMRGFARGGGVSAALAASKARNWHNCCEFDTYLHDALTNSQHSAAQRQGLMEHWEEAPSARECHPREEHLLPLHVIAGAANGPGRVVFDDELMGIKVSSFQFDG